MKMFMKVLAAKDNTCVQESGKDVCYLTLGDKNPASGNRYYISINGEDALSDWKNADMVELEIVLHAYRIEGQWHQALNAHSVNLIEIGTMTNNNHKS